jgi:L-cysteate sulfo-lyase
MVPNVASSILLGTWPTPMEPAPRLAASLGLDQLWIKRDDLVGLGGGGNKVRKLQYTCAAALEAGAATLITTGAPQSNHARLTAAAAARLGLRCVLVLVGDPPQASRGNLILDSLAGAEVVWAGGQAPAQVIEAEVAKRYKPYVIPFGGSSSESAQGYVDCAREIESQLPDFDRVVVAVGSGGTMAGLVAALGPERVFGVDTGALSDARMAVAELLDGMPDVKVDAADLKIDRGQIGGGYAKLTERVREALKLAARTEGLFLDPIYTGRAMANLIAGGVPRRGRTVFLHSGGLPGLFGHPEL